MKVIHSRLARLMVALCVALSIAIMPILFQQAMAAHHSSNGGIEHSIKGGHDMAPSCDEKSSKTSSEKSPDCCEIGCSPLFVFLSETISEPQVVSGEHFEFAADEVSSRMTYGMG